MSGSALNLFQLARLLPERGSLGISVKEKEMLSRAID
jgi:hypothetical protein